MPAGGYAGFGGKDVTFDYTSTDTPDAIPTPSY
jgi:hypothetical protein